VASENVCHQLGALLRYPLLAALVIHIADAEASLVTFRPFKVAALRSVSDKSDMSIRSGLLHETPRHVTSDIDVILAGSLSHGIDIITEIVGAKVVLQQLVE